MRRLGPVIAATVVLIGATGCGGSDDGAGQPSETVTVYNDPTEAVTPTGDSDETFEANVGDRALQIGQQRVGRLTTATLLEVRDPYPPAQYREAQPGNRYLGIRFSECLSDEYDPDDFDGQPLYATYNGEFVATTADGNEYPGNGSSYDDFPLPKFPENATITPGSCIKGWMALEVPEQQQFAKIVWRPLGETVAEWELR